MLVRHGLFVIVLACLQSILCLYAQARQDPVAGYMPKPAAMPAVENQQQQLRLLEMLLARAQRAMDKDQLMMPLNDNAYGWYQQVLLRDSSNAQAHRGMRQIGARYLDLAEQAYLAGDYSRAERLLERGERVSLSPQQVQRMREYYARQNHARQAIADNVFPLDGSALAVKSDAIGRRLAEIAVIAREQSSRLTIYARNDAEGRWIYKQMRAAVDGYRLRGNIEIDKSPRVILLDLKS